MGRTERMKTTKGLLDWITGYVLRTPTISVSQHEG